MVVENPHRARESELPRAGSDDERVLGIRYAAAEHRINGDSKLRSLGEPLKLPVEHLQTLLRHLVRHDVIDADLQVIEPGAVQTVDALGRQQESVRDQGRNGAAVAYTPNDRVEIRMKRRLATAQ